MIKLHDYQEALVPTMETILKDPDKRLALLALSTGTGKTYLSLELMRRVNCSFGVLAPKTVLGQWKRSCEAVGTKPKFVLNPESVRTGNKQHILVKKDKWSWIWTGLNAGDVLILDEIQRYSALDSQMAMMAASATSQGIKILGLSATLADSPLKLRLMLHAAKKVPWPRFLSWAAANGCARDERINGHPWRPPYGRACVELMDAVGKLLFPEFGVRLDSKDIPNYPECTTIVDPVTPSPAAAKAANEAYKLLSDAIKHPEKAANDLVQGLRFRQQIEHAKIHVFKELAEDALENGNSVIVAFNFRDPLFELKELMSKHDPVIVMGGQTATERQAQIDKFQSNSTKLMLIMTSAGGVGLDCGDKHGGHPRLLLASLPISTIELVQLLGRAHRSNSKTPTVNRVVLLEGVAVEEKVFKLLSRKVNNMSSLQGDDLSLESLLKDE